MRSMDKSEIAHQLRQRREFNRWWMTVHQSHPWGLVPTAVAARAIDVSPTRIAHLIQEGKLRLVDDMPGGNVRDRFIPFVDLLSAPALVEAGRIGVYGPENRRAGKSRR